MNKQHLWQTVTFLVVLLSGSSLHAYSVTCDFGTGVPPSFPYNPTNWAHYTFNSYDATYWDGWYATRYYTATDYDSGWQNIGLEPVLAGDRHWVFTEPGQAYKTVTGVAWVDLWVMVYYPPCECEIPYRLPDPEECDPHSQGQVIPQ
jgi:hypothetical protein